MRAVSRPLTRESPVGVVQAYADENGLFFMETSAKTATNVNGARSSALLASRRILGWVPQCESQRRVARLHSDISR
jgi:hypothetical protein